MMRPYSHIVNTLTSRLEDQGIKKNVNLFKIILDLVGAGNE